MDSDQKTRGDLRAPTLQQHFRHAIHGSDEGYELSLKTKPEIIDYARNKFDELSKHASVEQNQANVRSIHIAIFALKHMHHPSHDMWILDRTWDTDPLKGRSNAEMSHEMFTRAGIKDNAKIYASRGLSGFDVPEMMPQSIDLGLRGPGPTPR